MPASVLVPQVTFLCCWFAHTHSGWSYEQPDWSIQNARVTEATTFLMNNVIPEFAADIDA